MEALGDRHTVTAVPGVRLPGGMLSAQTWFICQAFSVSYSKIHSIIVTHLKSYCSYFNCAQSLQSCPALCDPLDCSPPGSCSWDFPGKNTGVGLLSCIRLFATPVDCSPPRSSVIGILQARVLEWVAIPFSRGSS